MRGSAPVVGAPVSAGAALRPRTRAVPPLSPARSSRRSPARRSSTTAAARRGPRAGRQAARGPAPPAPPRLDAALGRLQRRPQLGGHALEPLPLGLHLRALGLESVDLVAKPRLAVGLEPPDLALERADPVGGCELIPCLGGRLRLRRPRQPVVGQRIRLRRRVARRFGLEQLQLPDPALAPVRRRSGLLS